MFSYSESHPVHFGITMLRCYRILTTSALIAILSNTESLCLHLLTIVGINMAIITHSQCLLPTHHPEHHHDKQDPWT